MKKLFMLPALFALAVTGCGGDDPTPSGDVGWAQDVKEEMTEYLGLVLPFVQFDTATLYHGWNEDEGAYFIGDDSETNILDGYGDRLLRTGWTPVTEEGYVNYTKSTEVGDLTLHAEWYEATDLYPCGNEIAVYVEGQGGGDNPVTGTYEFLMSDYGWSDAEVISETTLAPGLTIDASKNGGSNDPKYYASGASIRLYPNNSITFSADNMTKIEFTFTRIDSDITFTPDSGTFSADYAAKTGVWTGDASSVTFTLGSGSGKQIRISAVKVTGTFSGGGDPIGPGGDERTIEDVALDICDKLGYTASDIEWDGEEAYISAVFEGVTNLLEACEAGIDYLPDYLEEDTAPYEDEWDDGDPGYFAYYVDSDNFVYVSIGSYADGNEFVTQFWVFYGY